jgi:hypothetical protein
MRGAVKWVMLVSGVLTCTMLYAAVAPQAMLQSSFGDTLEGPLADVVVRNWGALIVMVGVMLIYGAFNAAARPMALAAGAASKTVFIALVLSQGQRYLDNQVVVAVVADSLMVMSFVVFLLLPKEPNP